MEEIKKIHTKNFKLTDLPEPNIDWNQFCSFALSWDPTTELDDGQSVYWPDTLNKIPTEASSILDIRCYLYLQQRWWNNKTQKVDTKSLHEIHKVIEILRDKLDTQ